MPYNPIALSRTQDVIATLNPIFWFDPNRLAGLAASTKILNPVDNTGTQKLRPMSGILSANIPYTVPSSKNGKCTLRFNGVAHAGGYQFPSRSLSTFTAFQVLKPNASSGNIWPVQLSLNNGGSIYINIASRSPYNFASQVCTDGISIGGVSATSPGTYSPGSWYIVRTVYDGSTLTVYQNGSAGTPVAAVGKSANIDQFGIYGANTYLNDSEFGDSILFNSALSAGNQAAVESYLNSKWATY